MDFKEFIQDTYLGPFPWGPNDMPIEEMGLPQLYKAYYDASKYLSHVIDLRAPLEKTVQGYDFEASAYDIIEVAENLRIARNHADWCSRRISMIDDCIQRIIYEDRAAKNVTFPVEHKPIT